MIVLSGADVVLPEGVQSGAAIVLDGERIIDITDGSGASGSGAIDLRNHIVFPGFIDVHVHGLEGIDTLDGFDAVVGIARRLPKYGVTAFCPTTVACAPQKLREVLESVAVLRGGFAAAVPDRPSAPKAAANRADAFRVDQSGEAVEERARVLPAHLESNFINPDYRGAQPIECLRSPEGSLSSMASRAPAGSDFNGADIVAEIVRARENVGIVTLAPELDGGLDLIRHLVDSGCRVSLGHSGATRDEARAAIAAGARHATHLFNRMPPLNHQEPGLVGAILTSEEIAAEIICDGVHVHRDMVQLAISAKGTSGVMAITDGVAAAGLPDGSVASLGGRQIHVKARAAYLDDGTRAGSVATMDTVVRFLVNDVRLSLSDAAQLCATTPARALGLAELGAITKGAVADLVVMDRRLTVAHTYVAGRLVYSRAGRTDRL
jgi:N-acetylglucosamine-6-phosphate deacetylase